MKVEKCSIIFVAVCLFQQAACAKDNEANTGQLTWSSKDVVSELHSVEVDCGDAQYKISISRRGLKEPVLEVIQRTPTPVTEEIKSSFAELVDEFAKIDTISASCGAGPGESPRDQILASNRNEDFSGKLQITLAGLSSADERPAAKECRAKGGFFVFTTKRVATLSLDSLKMKPGMIGTCYLPGRIQVSE